MLVFQRLLFALIVWATVVVPAAYAQKRIALVIGNSEYKHTPRLTNPKNDAADMTAALKQLQFFVIEGRDLDKAGMDRTIRDFAEALAGAQVGLFFYAGHGLQVGGQNYLVPIDAKLTTASGVDFEMVRLDLVHRTMEREATTNILIMDACRDNPLARNLARALGTRSTQIGRGLAVVESGEGTLISFSTQPGNVALDGTGRNSPFAEAFLKHIRTPGDDLPTILINVRNDVMQATGRRQVPWEHSAMTAKFYFIPPRPTGQQIELQFWMSVKDNTNPAVLGTYLERYPTGEYALIARALVEQYDRQLKLELAAREQERRRQEDEMKAAEAKRLGDEQRAREATLAAERKRAEEAKNSRETARLEKERADLLARNEELRKALEEARVAREAAKTAEEQRLAAVRAAESATKAANETITKKRDADSSPAKLAALPKLEQPMGQRPFDGTWTVSWIGGTGCAYPRFSTTWRISNGTIAGSMGKGAISGKVSNTGALTANYPAGTDGALVRVVGTLGGRTGRGTAGRPDGRCNQTFTATRN
jgi:uncharacterized caspase-like protein